MDQSDIQEAIERNGDIILITCFVVFDLMITGWILRYSTTIQQTAMITNDIGLQYRPLRLFIDYRLLNGLLIFKSLILYMTAFQTARRLPKID